jgi:hypothetical protein
LQVLVKASEGQGFVLFGLGILPHPIDNRGNLMLNSPHRLSSDLPKFIPVLFPHLMAIINVHRKDLKA